MHSNETLFAFSRTLVRATWTTVASKTRAAGPCDSTTHGPHATADANAQRWLVSLEILYKRRVVTGRQSLNLIFVAFQKTPTFTWAPTTDPIAPGTLCPCPVSTPPVNEALAKGNATNSSETLHATIARIKRSTGVCLRPAVPGPIQN